ncbi:hypothetical protein PNOK_0506900 [Pyrrhoderma noxium]|uniref:Uncharacterized protein n=1 Tax=Pyrrhoderma noxium TaxID=2282107 RepID=A0A286UL07_9AGAM|nr:hypothetical protein PNOK_0506900 [Pyrrhoderma noxium]
MVVSDRRVLGLILANEVQRRTRGSAGNLYQGKTLEISIKRGREIIMTMPNLNLISLCSHRGAWCFRKRGSKQRGRKPLSEADDKIS